MHQKRRPRSTDVYVSAFITDHLIPDDPSQEAIHFTLHGAGHGWWETIGDAVEIESADLFVMVNWVAAALGAYEIVTEVKDLDSRSLAVLHREIVEIPEPHYAYQWNKPLKGLTLPKGMFYLWISVDGDPKVAIPLRVFGADEPLQD